MGLYFFARLQQKMSLIFTQSLRDLKTLYYHHDVWIFRNISGKLIEETVYMAEHVKGEIGMVRTYNDYIKLSLCVELEEAQELHREIAGEIRNDEDALEIYNELIEKAAEYSVIRAHWTIKERSWQTDNDFRRTQKHDAMIRQFDALAHCLKRKGKDAAWRDRLGYEENSSYCRKRIGDFGCYLAFIQALNGR